IRDREFTFQRPVICEMKRGCSFHPQLTCCGLRCHKPVPAIFVDSASRNTADRPREKPERCEFGSRIKTPVFAIDHHEYDTRCQLVHIHQLRLEEVASLARSEDRTRFESRCPRQSEK